PCSCALSCAHGKTGVGRPAQPARGMPRAHGAHAPATGPTPPSTDLHNLSGWHDLLLVGVDLGRHVDPRHAWMKSNPFDDLEIGRNVHPRMAWIYYARDTVRGGAVWAGRTVGAMGPRHALGRVGQDAQPRSCRVRRTAHTSKAPSSPMDGFTACPACPYRPAHLGSRFRCCFGSGLCGCRAAARPIPPPLWSTHRWCIPLR
ncbi:UNVERIFIED_ORG: hypothetical protein ABIC77_001630, partial [Stenotrophomonas geniculata]